MTRTFILFALSLLSAADLPTATEIKRRQVDLKTASPEKSFVLEATTNGREWKPLSAKTEGSTLTAIVAGQERALGELKSSLNRFPLPAATTAIKISAPASLYEVIWTTE